MADLLHLGAIPERLEAVITKARCIDAGCRTCELHLKDRVFQIMVSVSKQTLSG